jgi:hypothetical protein
MYIPGRPQVEFFLYNRSGGLKHAACQFILRSPPIDLFPITERSSAQLSVKELLFFFLI